MLNARSYVGISSGLRQGYCLAKQIYTGPMPPPIAFDITAVAAVLPTGAAAVALKLSSPQLEVNVWLPRAQAGTLATVIDREPTARALQLGVAAGSAAHWARDEQGDYHLLIGEDAETWDIGLTFDQVTFAALVAAVNEVLSAER